MLRGFPLSAVTFALPTKHKPSIAWLHKKPNPAGLAGPGGACKSAGLEWLWIAAAGKLSNR